MSAPDVGGGQGMAVRIHRERAFAVLLMVDAMLIVLHLLTRVVTWRGEPIVRRHEFLDVGAEISLPTWWQQSQVLAAAALCVLIGGTVGEDPGRQRRRWMVLGAILVYVSLDEGTQLHEGLTDPTRRALDLGSGLLTFAWVIPAAGALALFGIVYARFWWGIPSRPRTLMAVGGLLFVAGAVGVEMVGGWYREEYGADRGYELIVAIEEGLEMVGISVFVLSLLTLLRLRQGSEGIALRVESG